MDNYQIDDRIMHIPFMKRVTIHPKMYERGGAVQAERWNAGVDFGSETSSCSYRKEVA